MYKCESCGALIGPGVRQNLKILSTRKKIYPYRKRANKYKKGRKTIYTDDPGGVGWEIEKNQRVCESCLKGDK